MVAGTSGPPAGSPPNQRHSDPQAPSIPDGTPAAAQSAAGLVASQLGVVGVRVEEKMNLNIARKGCSALTSVSLAVPRWNMA